MKMFVILIMLMSVTSFSDITGLIFSADTVFGMHTDSQPQGFSIRNTTEFDISIDSVVFKSNDMLPGGPNLSYSITPVSDMDANYRNWHSFGQQVIKARDSFVVCNVSLLVYYLGKKHVKESDGAPNYWVTGVFWAAGESKRILFLVAYHGVGKIEMPNGYNHAIKGFQITPNPFSSMLRISNLAPVPDGKLQIYNLQGECIQEINNKTSSILNWTPGNISAGYYYLKYQVAHECFSQKVLFLK